MPLHRIREREIHASVIGKIRINGTCIGAEENRDQETMQNKIQKCF